MQYPATRDFSTSHTILRFVDGTQQCYRESQNVLRRWLVRLDLLDEAELAALQAFFISNQGRVASFQFTDPWDNTAWPDCSLDQDIFDFTLSAEMRASTSLVVKENRS